MFNKNIEKENLIIIIIVRNNMVWNESVAKTKACAEILDKGKAIELSVTLHEKSFYNYKGKM